MAKVYLHVYEVTKGLAAQLSSALLGRHIRGVWHTGVVCFGTEYCFGSGGIMQMNPGETIIGAPDDVVDLGETHVSFDLFYEFLFAVGEDQFRPEKYHLFEHNCNNFSNEVAQFLTGKKIPSYILDLPRDVANTPVGAMLKTFMDGMGSPVGGRLDNTTRPLANLDMHSSHSSLLSRSQHDTRGPETSVKKSDCKSETHVTFTYDVEECCNRLHHLFENTEDIINPNIIDDETRNDEKLEKAVDSLQKLLDILEEKKEKEHFISFVDILSILSLRNGLKILKVRKGPVLFKRLIKTFRECSFKEEVASNVLKLGSNLFSDQQHRDWLMNEHNDDISGLDKCFIAECVECLLSSKASKETVDVGLVFAYNMSLAKMDEELEIELSSALLHWVGSAEKGSLQARRCVLAIKNFMRSNQQVRELAEMTTDPSMLEL